MQISIDIFDDDNVYRDACNGLQNTYSVVERFVRSLETILNGKSTVESNFLVVK